MDKSGIAFLASLGGCQQFLPFKYSSACREGVMLIGGNGGQIIQVKALPSHPPLPSAKICQVLLRVAFFLAVEKALNYNTLVLISSPSLT